MVDYTILLISLILAIDCFVVSVCISSSLKISKKEYFRIPFHFGLFQGGMAVLGFYLGLSFLKIIQGFDHWVAFSLLLLIGIKMIYDSFKKENKINKISYGLIILLSIATSIDALAVGVTFGIAEGGILMKSLMIGIFSFVLGLIGLLLGEKLKSFKLQYLGILGGFVLIGLGMKTLFEHL